MSHCSACPADSSTTGHNRTVLVPSPPITPGGVSNRLSAAPYYFQLSHSGGKPFSQEVLQSGRTSIA